MSDTAVVSEPPIYRREGPHSFFKDVLEAERGMQGPKNRLMAHAYQSAKEQRAHPDRVQGQGGYFAPPAWLIEDFASVPRPKRVLANLIPTFPLPAGVQSMNIPVLTTGTSTGTVQDDASLTDTDITDTAVSSAVVTITGQDDVSQQLLDQSPSGAHLDWVMFKDLNEDYDAKLEAQLLSGTGANGQLLGLLNITSSNSPSNINTITYTSGSPTATAMFTYFGQAVAAIGINRKQPPETWLMTTARQAWIASSEDSQSRPLMVVGSTEPGQFQLVQYPARPDDAIPRNLGTGTNQDVVIACKPSDMLLWESEPHTLVSFEPGSGTLGARLQLRRYTAAILNRYPTGTAVLTGTGMATPSGF